GLLVEALIEMTEAGERLAVALVRGCDEALEDLAQIVGAQLAGRSRRDRCRGIALGDGWLSGERQQQDRQQQPLTLQDMPLATGQTGTFMPRCTVGRADIVAIQRIRLRSSPFCSMSSRRNDTVGNRAMSAIENSPARNSTSPRRRSALRS